MSYWDRIGTVLVACAVSAAIAYMSHRPLTIEVRDCQGVQQERSKAK